MGFNYIPDIVSEKKCRKCGILITGYKALCDMCETEFRKEASELEFLHDMNEKRNIMIPDDFDDFDLNDYEYQQDMYNESGLARRCPLDI